MSDFPLLLAKEMGVSRRTVQRLCGARKVPGAYRTNGGHWRLRKPRGIQWCKGRRYDDKIVEFVVRYTSVAGEPLSARQAGQLNKIVQWLDDLCLVPATVSMGRRVIRYRPDNTPTIDWQFVTDLGKRIDSKDFNAALEFSFGAAGISDDDKLPRDWKKIPVQERGRAILKHFEELKDRDPKKYDLLTQRDISKMMHPMAYEAAQKPHGILAIKANKLRLNMREVTPQNLACELKISVPTLYRRYGHNFVSQVCKERPVFDESSTGVRYQING